MTATALRAGFSRGLTELRQSFAGTAAVNQLLWPVLTLAAIFLLRGRAVGAGPVGLGAVILPGSMGMFVALGTLLVVQHLATDREDGTLLRARAIPGGIAGYLVGKLVTVSAGILIYLVILLVPGMLIVHGIDVAWPLLAWVLVLGMVGTQSVGAALGALIATPRGASYMSLPILGLTAISGIFYPITAWPQWLQWIAQVFPMYWLGLGMRSALLPGNAAAIEIGQSWRHLETAGVLGAWAVAGLILAPIVLRRMARRESGARLAARRAAMPGRAA